MNYVVAVLAVVIYSAGIIFLTKPITNLGLHRFLLCVFFGMISAFIALGSEFLWNYFLGDFIISHPSLVFLESFIGVSLIEETAKWLWLVLIISQWKNFRFLTDGIFYTCGIAAGFSLIEGGLYATLNVNMIMRSITAVPVHFLLAVSMGFLFARYQLGHDRFLWPSWLVPIVLHGLYDFFILQPYAETLIGAALLVLAGSLFLSIWICRIALTADRLKLAILKTEEERRN